MAYASVPYLDVDPMIIALRATAEAFTMNGKWLRHIPSHHDFKFDEGAGKVSLRANCSCAQLIVRDWQQTSLVIAFQKWRVDYWTPKMINAEFASHFARRSAWRDVLVRFTGWLHALALRPERTPEKEHRPALSSASAVNA